MTHLHQLLADCLALSEGQAVAIVQVLVSADVLSADALDRFERDARLYQLRGCGVGCADLGQRFGMARSKVYESIRRHAKARRAALRLVA